MKITPAVSLLAICSTVALAQRAEDPRVVVVQSALRLAQSGKPAEACSQFRSISATPRDHVWATARLAIADIASSCAPPQRPEAIYDEVIQTGMPADAALARNNKGLLWLNSRPNDALKLFQDAAAAPASIPPDPNRGLYRTNLGAVYERRQQWSNALDAYRANAVEGLDLPATTASLSRIFVQKDVLQIRCGVLLGWCRVQTTAGPL